MRYYSIFGSTNVGKSTYIEKAAANRGPWSNLKIATAQIGKELRKRYPPSYFKGSGACDHTEKEALDLLQQFVDQSQDADVLLIDGQPRRVDHIDPILKMCPELEVIWLFEPDEIITERAKKRAEQSDDPIGHFKLSKARMVNDKLQLWPVVWELLRRKVPFHCVTEQI